MMSPADNKHRDEGRDNIFRALVILLERKRYSEIGIDDICREAYISRPTFYRYFKNKDNIIRWETKKIFSIGVSRIGRQWTWQEGFFITVSALYKYRSFYADPDYLEFTSGLFEFCEQMLTRDILETISLIGCVAVTERIRFVVEAMSASTGVMTMKWIKSGMKIEPKMLSEYLVATVPQEIYELLNTSQAR